MLCRASGPSKNPGRFTHAVHSGDSRGCQQRRPGMRQASLNGILMKSSRPGSSRDLRRHAHLKSSLDELRIGRTVTGYENDRS